jgi:hypothetical protein
MGQYKYLLPSVDPIHFCMEHSCMPKCKNPFCVSKKSPQCSTDNPIFFSRLFSLAILYSTSPLNGQIAGTGNPFKNGSKVTNSVTAFRNRSLFCYQCLESVSIAGCWISSEILQAVAVAYRVSHILHLVQLFSEAPLKNASLQNSSLCSAPHQAHIFAIILVSLHSNISWLVCFVHRTNLSKADMQLLFWSCLRVWPSRLACLMLLSPLIFFFVSSAVSHLNSLNVFDLSI